jgi:stearoyl-CoA desaturase (delta-9 desaturase)
MKFRPIFEKILILKIVTKLNHYTVLIFVSSTRDYKTSELGDYGFNWTNAFIDFFAKIGRFLIELMNLNQQSFQYKIFLKFSGWAYDLKTVSDDIIRRRIERTGDGTHKYSLLKTPEERLDAMVDCLNNNCVNYNNLWGWEDKDMEEVDKRDALVLNGIKKD